MVKINKNLLALFFVLMLGLFSFPRSTGALETLPPWLYETPESTVIPVAGTLVEFSTICDQATTYAIFVDGQVAPTNHFISLENIGTTIIENPWVVADNRNNWFDTSHIINEAVQGATNDEEKAFAIWRFLRDNRYHWCPAEAGNEVHDPTKFLNVYGYGFCDDSASNYEALAKNSGFSLARCWGLSGHVVPEVYYHGAWHMFDPDLKVFYPRRDNITIAGVEDCAADGWLVERVSGPTIASLYTTTYNNSSYQNNWQVGHTMACQLRPGESLERYWSNWGKYHDNLYHQEPPQYGNGNWIYQPDLTTNHYRLGIEAEGNVESFADSGTTPNLHLAWPGSPAWLIIKFTSPYVFVGGNVQLEGFCVDTNAYCQIYFSRNNTSWTLLYNSQPNTGSVFADIDYSELVENGVNAALYQYYLKFIWQADEKHGAGIQSITVSSDIQLAPKSLPALTVGENIICYGDPGAEPRLIRITHSWYENTTQLPPQPVVNPVYPADNETIADLSPELSWEPASDPDGVIADYKILVALDPQCRWPVTPILEATTGATPVFATPAGWLNPHTTYYWRVWAIDNDGHRGPASPIWSYTISPSTAVKNWWLY